MFPDMSINFVVTAWLFAYNIKVRDRVFYWWTECFTDELSPKLQQRSPQPSLIVLPLMRQLLTPPNSFSWLKRSPLAWPFYWHVIWGKRLKWLGRSDTCVLLNIHSSVDEAPASSTTSLRHVDKCSGIGLQEVNPDSESLKVWNTSAAFHCNRV